MERLVTDEANNIVDTNSIAIGDGIPLTPVVEHKRVVLEFLMHHRCKVKDLQDAAGVDRAGYYKWLNGSLKDHYSTCVEIERVLRQGPHPPKAQQGCDPCS